MNVFRPTHRPRVSFNLKILLTLAAILIAFALTLGLTFSLIQRKAIRNHLYEQGRLMVTMLSGSLQSGLFFEDRATIIEAVTQLLSRRLNDDLQMVAVYNVNDGLVFRQGVADSGTVLDAQLADAMSGALAAFHQHSSQEAAVWEDKGLLIFTAPVSVAANEQSHESLYFDTARSDQHLSVIGYGQLAMSRRHLEAMIGKTLVQTAALTLLFLLIALAASFLLTRATLTPLKQLINSIRSRGGKEMGQPDEVGLLGDTFSRLVQDLEAAFSTIEGLKEGLEETVAERTSELSCALTELRETHIQLTQVEKMVAIGRLVAGVAHEINNTTNFVSGALPPLRKKITEMETIAHGFNQEGAESERCAALFTSVNVLLDNISEGARRTNKIVGDLKSFSRPVDEEPGPVDINRCLSTTCSLAYPQYKHRIKLELDLAEELPLVEGAQGQLNQVFMNLLLNAVQAMPEQGTILIRSWLAADQVHVLFRDSGPGIPEEVMNLIFEPFFTTKGVGKGTGLGLSISYGIIRKHQGEILVRSEPGQGTDFEIILPLRRQKDIVNLTTTKGNEQ
ncbi:MAG: ATP-binding protein [Pseudomonadota bacterium]